MYLWFYFNSFSKVRDQVVGWSCVKGKSVSDAQKPEYVGKENFGKLYFNMIPV